MTEPPAPDLLAAIVAGTRRRVEAARSREPLADLERRAAERQPDAAGFRAALSRASRLNVIAECKRRSPSRGVLRADYDPAAIALRYAESGAAAISVLTEPMFFDGALPHLEAVRAVTGLPLLRKDFIVEDYQLIEARAAGADAALLIVAALVETQLRHLLTQARTLGLAVLVEVHTDDELDRALNAGADIIGVNNRDLRTLRVDLQASARLISQIPESAVAVAESGLRCRQDLIALRGDGYDAFLVGERLVTMADPGAALQELLTGDERS
jgi:indole-3-glycerol phosphate synthase